MNGYIELAYKVAKRSTHKHHHMAAVLIKGGSIIGAAANRPGHCCERRILRPHLDLRGTTIIIVRSNGGMSKPCDECQQAIQMAGIKKVIYFNWDGTLIICKPAELNN